MGGGNLTAQPDSSLNCIADSDEHRTGPTAKQPTNSPHPRFHHALAPNISVLLKDALCQAALDPQSAEGLHRTTPVVEIRDGLDTFRFPTPSPRRVPCTATLPTFRHAPSPLQYESPSIGVAIGSPSNAPPNWGRSHTTDYVSGTVREPPRRMPPLPPVRMDSIQTVSVQQRKKSSWKLFGDMFRKPKSAPQQPNYNCIPPSEFDWSDTQPLESPRIRSLPSPRAKLSLSPSSHGALSYDAWPTRSEARTKPHQSMDRTAHMPSIQIRTAHAAGNSGSTSPLPRIDVSEPIDETPSSPQLSVCSSPRFESAIDRPMPQLNLDLPAPTFDRYSIMFEKLLKTEFRPSLYERRQSRLVNQELKNEGYGVCSSEDSAIDIPAPLPQRSATTSHSPRPLSIVTAQRHQLSFRLEATISTVNRPRPQRSNTAPCLGTPGNRVVSPSNIHAASVSSPESQHSALYSENSLPPTPASTCTDTESFNPMSELREPTWDMLTSKAVKIVSPLEPKIEPYPRVMSPEDLERQIVQVSVARSVSVNRAHSRVAKALPSKQPRRPRLVELDKNRKSAVGILVSTAGDVEQMPAPVLS